MGLFQGRLDDEEEDADRRRECRRQDAPPLFYCNRCRQQLEQPGALIFAPPVPPSILVEKYHVCVQCFRDYIRPTVV